MEKEINAYDGKSFKGNLSSSGLDFNHKDIEANINSNEDNKAQANKILFLIKKINRISTENKKLVNSNILQRDNLYIDYIDKAAQEKYFDNINVDNFVRQDNITSKIQIRNHPSFQNRTNAISTIEEALIEKFENKSEILSLICLSQHNGIGKTRLLYEMPIRVKTLQINKQTNKIFYFFISFKNIQNKSEEESIHKVFYSNLLLALWNINTKIEFPIFKNEPQYNDIPSLISSIFLKNLDVFKSKYKNIFEYKIEEEITQLYNSLQVKLSDFSRGVFLIDEVGDLAMKFMNSLSFEGKKKKCENDKTNYVNCLSDNYKDYTISLYYLWNSIFFLFQEQDYIEIIVAGTNGFLPFMEQGAGQFDNKINTRNSPSNIHHINLRALDLDCIQNILKDFIKYENGCYLTRYLLNYEEDIERNIKVINKNRLDELTKFLVKVSAGHPRLLFVCINKIEEILKNMINTANESNQLELELKETDIPNKQSSEDNKSKIRSIKIESLEDKLFLAIPNAHYVNYSFNIIKENSISSHQIIGSLIILSRVEANLLLIEKEIKRKYWLS